MSGLACGRDLPSESGVVQIAGFEGIGEDRIVLVEPVSPPTEATRKLQETSEKHGTVQVKVAEVVCGWGPPYLACRETDTGVRVVLGHHDLSLNQRDQQFAEMVPTGAVFDVTAKWFDPTDWLLHATRIPQLLREWNRIASNASEGGRARAPARIVGTAEFNDRQVFVAVDWKDNDDVLCRFCVPKQWLIDRKIVAEGEEPLPVCCVAGGGVPLGRKRVIEIPGVNETVGGRSGI